jgi:hypothetical protein
MNHIFKASALCGIALLLSTGCKKTADNTANYRSAIDAYFAAHPACLWPQPIQFPVQVNRSDTTKTAAYDALYDAGLLTRTSEEKKVLIVATKPVATYDLNDKGRGEWSPDTTHPGFGNFCYGHRKVDTIVSATSNNGEPGATTQASYLYSFINAPDWSQAIETQTEFPKVGAAVNSHGGGVLTLTDTTGGWKVQPSATNPDATIVQ